MTKGKKTVALLLACLLVLSLAACGKNGPETGDNENTQAPASDPGPAESNSTEELLSDAPESYDYAVLVSINPEFLLYLRGREVFAYEALNEDAATVAERAAILNRGIDGVLDDIVRFSYEEGFLKDGDEVNVTLVSAFRTQTEAEELLQEARTAVQDSAGRCGVAVKPVITVESTVAFPMPEPTPAPEPADREPSEQDASEPGQEPSGSEGSSGEPDEGQESGGEPVEESGGEPENQPRDENEGCPVCGGSGVCDVCEGSGLLLCEECGGSGYETCSKCGGEGYAGSDENGPVLCDQCGGTGLVLHENCGGDGLVTCNHCEGSGLCEVCGGTGLNPHN